MGVGNLIGFEVFLDLASSSGFGFGGGGTFLGKTGGDDSGGVAFLGGRSVGGFGGNGNEFSFWIA